MLFHRITSFSSAKKWRQDRDCTFQKRRVLSRTPPAEVAKLADAPDLGSGSARSKGSSPFLGTSLPQSGQMSGDESCSFLSFERRQRPFPQKRPTRIAACHHANRVWLFLLSNLAEPTAAFVHVRRVEDPANGSCSDNHCREHRMAIALQKLADAVFEFLRFNRFPRAWHSRGMLFVVPPSDVEQRRITSEICDIPQLWTESDDQRTSGIQPRSKRPFVTLHYTCNLRRFHRQWLLCVSTARLSLTCAANSPACKRGSALREKAANTQHLLPPKSIRWQILDIGWPFFDNFNARQWALAHNNGLNPSDETHRFQRRRHLPKYRIRK